MSDTTPLVYNYMHTASPVIDRIADARSKIDQHIRKLKRMIGLDQGQEIFF